MAFNVQQALKDGYTMEEINQYLKSSSSTPTPQSSQPKSNNLAEKAMNLLQDLSSPIRFAKSAAIQSPILALTGGKVNTYDLPGVGKMTGLSEQELQKMYGDGSLKQRATKTMTQAGKEGLEAASYGVPFGKGANIITKALLPGAGVGAMQSLSGDNVNAKDVGVNALLSALTAGVINKIPGGQKATKGITSILPEERSGNVVSNLLKGTGKEIKGAGRNFERVVQNNPFFTSSLEKMNKVADDLKLAGSNKAQLQKAEQSFNSLSDQVSSKLKSSNVKIPAKSLFTDLSERLKTTPYYDPTDSKYLNETRKIFNEINKNVKGGVVDINDIYKAKQSIGSKYKKAWTKATPNEADIVAMNMYNELKNIINEAVPGVSKLTEKQSTIFDITNALGKSINTSTVTLGALTPKVPGMARGTQALTNQLGRAVEGAGSLAQAPKLPQNEAVTRLLSMLSSPQAQKVGAVATSKLNTQAPVGQVQAGEQSNNFPTLPNEYSIQEPTPNTGTTPSTNQPVITNEELTLLMLLDPKNASTYSAIAELQGGGATKQKPLSSTTENRVQLANSGLRALNELESLYQSDPTKVLKSRLPGSIGARDYESASLRAVEGLLRARSGAAVPETEVIRYRNANLPRVGDSRQTALNKLAAFRKDLEEVANSGATMPNNLEVLQNAGIDLGL